MRPNKQRITTAEKCNSSMQLTRAADYAVRVMIYLATLPEEQRALLPDLARVTETPVSFLSKVLQSLAHAQLISSRRGKTGGFAILPRGRGASMREVIEVIDGPISLNVCLNEGKGCDRRPWCPAHPVWARAQRAMLDVLMSATVSAMAERATPVQASAPSSASSK
jgi:Rrf2 family protein